MTDAWSLRGLLGQEGCRDNEMQDVETKAEEEGNTTDRTLDRRRKKGRRFAMRRNPFMLCSLKRRHVCLRRQLVEDAPVDGEE